MNPDAYVIADYLLTAATRLVISDPSLIGAVRAVLAGYGDTPEVDAARAFLDALERAQEPT